MDPSALLRPLDAANNGDFGRGAWTQGGRRHPPGRCGRSSSSALRLDGDLVFQFVLEDEITGNGSLACLEAGHIADAAIIVDGTRPDRAIDRHAGNMEFHVALKGRPASVSVSHMGANAAEMLSRMLLDLRNAFFRLNDKRQAPWTEFPSPYQLVIHGLNADAPRFCVPVDASARCFTTFPPPDTIASVRRFLEEESVKGAQANGYPHAPVFVWEGFAAEPVSCASAELAALWSQRSGRASRDPGRAHRSVHWNIRHAPLRQARHTRSSLRPGPRLQPAPRRRAFPARRPAADDAGLPPHGDRVV